MSQNPYSAAKCLMILSTRSAGSTALYRFLLAEDRCAGVRPRSNIKSELKDETAWWVNAAVLFRKPILDVAGGKEFTDPRSHLRDTLIRNLGPGYSPPVDDLDLVFDGWRDLCQRFGPIFVEKSPHHLYQWSALEMIVDSVERLSDVTHCIVGLIRNPIANVYSQWNRWRFSPRKTEQEWMLAYTNLLRLKERLPSSVLLIRYEDLVTDPEETLSSVCCFAGIDCYGAEQYFKHDSLMKWRDDSTFDFYRPSKQTIRFAHERFGYCIEDLEVPSFRAVRYCRAYWADAVSDAARLARSLAKQWLPSPLVERLGTKRPP